MKIKIEQSGGFTGVMISREIDADVLTTSLKGTVKKLLEDEESRPMKVPRPKGAADYLNFKIIIEDGTRNRVIECNQFDMNDRLKELVKFVEHTARKER